MTRFTYTAAVPDTAERPATWKDSAVCRTVDPELFFPTQGDSQGAEDARAHCAACPVRLDCLEDALQAETGRGPHHRHGIYGGLTPRQRYRLHLSRTGQKAAA